MPYVYALRETRIVTMNGDSVLVEPRKPKEVNNRLLADCLNSGCVECDADGKILLGDVAPPKVAADDIPFLTVEQRADTGKRRAVLKMAIAHLYKEQDKTNFKADGLPRNAAIEKLVRFPVSNAEITELLEKLEDA